MKTLLAAIAITVTTLTLHGVDDELHGVDTWAGLRPQPAVVDDGAALRGDSHHARGNGCGRPVEPLPEPPREPPRT